MQVSRKRVELHFQERMQSNLPAGSLEVAPGRWSVPFDGEMVTLRIEHGGPSIDGIPSVYAYFDDARLGFFTTAIELADEVRATLEDWSTPF